MMGGERRVEWWCRLEEDVEEQKQLKLLGVLLACGLTAFRRIGSPETCFYGMQFHPENIAIISTPDKLCFTTSLGDQSLWIASGSIGYAPTSRTTPLSRCCTIYSATL
jgi:hypothetical protein